MFENGPFIGHDEWLLLDSMFKLQCLMVNSSNDYQLLLLDSMIYPLVNQESAPLTSG